MELPESETDSTEGILILSTPEPAESSQIPEKLQYTDSAHSLVYSVTPWQYVFKGDGGELVSEVVVVRSKVSPHHIIFSGASDAC